MKEEKILEKFTRFFERFFDIAREFKEKLFSN